MAKKRKPTPKNAETGVAFEEFLRRRAEVCENPRIAAWLLALADGDSDPKPEPPKVSNDGVSPNS